MGRGGTWLTSRGYQPVDPNVMMNRQSSSSSEFGCARAAEEAPIKPFKPDPRMTFDTKTIRFYAFETSDDNAPQKPPNTVRGILDPLQDRTCDQITGRRKKEDTLKMNNMERLVGMDGPARPGDRVIISSRSKEVRKQGWPVVGTIIEILDHREYAAVQWDDGRGPYKYSIAKTNGFQLAFIEKDHEADYVKSWRHRPAIYWAMNRGHAHSGDAVAGICEALRDRGCDIYDDLQASGTQHMAVDVPKARMAVICLTGGYVSDCNRRGECRSELEYVVQHMGPDRVLVLILERGLSIASLGNIASPLGRSKTIDFTAGKDKALEALKERFSGIQPVSVPPSRVSTPASDRR